MSDIINIQNKAEFDNLINSSNHYYVLDFYADWCGPCKMMMPIFERASKTEEMKAFKFAKINRDQNRDLIEAYGFQIPTIPRFFVVKFNANGNFDQSNILKELGGSQSKSEIIAGVLEVAKKEGVNIQETEAKLTNPDIEKEDDKKKVAIIGAGPAGLTAAIYTSRAQLDTTIYTGMQPGGQLTTTTEIENFPGAWDPNTKEGRMGPDLMLQIQQQAEHFGAKTKVEEVSELKPVGNKFELTTFSGTETYDAVVVATGASARYLGIKGEEQWVGKGYHSCATCDGFFYKGKTIAVVGGGDSAMEEANFLTKFAEKVYLIHRHNEFKASKIMLERAKKNPKIELLLWKQIVEFIGEDKVQAVTLEDTQTKEKSKLELDGVFVAIGHIPNSGFVGNILDKDNAGYLIPQYRVAPSERVSKYHMGTKIPGIFVAGDIEDTTYRQAITAAGDGCRAAMDVEKWLEEQE